MTASRPVRHGDVLFEPPPDWTDLTQPIFAGPVQDGFRANLVVTRDVAEPDETSEGYARRHLSKLQKQLADYAIISEGNTVLGSLSGFAREHRFSSDKRNICQMQLYVVRAGSAQTFTFTDLASHWEKARDEARRLLAQVKTA